MIRPRILDFILLGLLAWGVPTAIILGPVALLWVAATCLPVWAMKRWTARHPVYSGPGLDPPLAPLVGLALAYLAFDALLGRQKLAQNMFLSGGALEKAIEQINEGVSRGRGLAELLGAVLAFLPFSVFDLARRAHGRAAAAGWMAGILFVFYDAAISRGFTLVAVLSVLAGSRLTWRRAVIGGGVAISVFLAASFLRGDFRDVTFANPLFDAVGWPYLNLALLHGGECGTDGVVGYGLEFLKKFLPAFVLQKTIFTFNVEMTRCIYPMFGDAVASVSVFTYVGEFVYYTPAWATTLLAGSLLALLGAGCDALLDRADLPSTRAFAGLMSVVLLRSRTQDVLSFLIFLALFLGGWLGITSEWLRKALARPTAEAVRE